MPTALLDLPAEKLTGKQAYGVRAELIASMETLLKSADGDLSEVQQSRFDAMDKQLRAVNLRIEAYQAEQEHIRSLHDTANDPGLFGFGGGQSPSGTGGRRRGAKTYAAMFGGSPGSDGWGSLDQYLQAVHFGLADSRLRIAASAGEGVGSAGGFLVPEEYAGRLLDASLEGEIVRPRGDVWPMKSETLKVPGIDASDSSSNLFGGIAAEWIGESGTLTAQDIGFRKLELHARKLALLSKASNEISADGLGFESQLETALTTACSWYLDYAFLRGTGSGQPLGVLNDPAVVEVAAEVQAPSTILYQNLVKMLARLHPRCFPNSVWVASSTTIPQLLRLTIDTGTAGSHIPVMKESDGAFSVLTRPCIFTEKLPALGTAGDIILVDFSQYAIGMRREMTLDRSGHIFFESDETAYRVIVRVDGQGKWSGPYTPKTGDTQSWIVTLASR